MNDGGYVSKVGILAGVFWALGVGLLIAAWLAGSFAPDHWLVARLLATTACVASVVAATLQIKTYMCRLSRLIAATSHLRDAEVEPGVRALR